MTSRCLSCSHCTLTLLFQGLEKVHDDMVTMETLVYSCHMEESLTFEHLQEMTDYEKVELIMSKVR